MYFSIRPKIIRRENPPKTSKNIIRKLDMIPNDPIVIPASIKNNPAGIRHFQANLFSLYLWNLIPLGICMTRLLQLLQLEYLSKKWTASLDMKLKSHLRPILILSLTPLRFDLYPRLCPFRWMEMNQSELQYYLKKEKQHLPLGQF